MGVRYTEDERLKANSWKEVEVGDKVIGEPLSCCAKIRMSKVK